MNHFVLPRPDDRGRAEWDRYGTTSTEGMIREMMEMGCTVRWLRAQVFGGAVVLRGRTATMLIGQQNVEAAICVLAAWRIRIIHRETGGTRGRRILFDTSTGRVQCRFTGDIPRKKRAAAD